jgi:hypothetical protein
MRRFLLTSTKFIGTVELVYNEQEHLRRLDFIDTNLEPEQIFGFLKTAPITIKHLENGVGLSQSSTVIEAAYEISFEDFWKAYPLRRNRFRVEKQWAKMPKTEIVKAFFSLPGYCQYLKKNAWQTPMIADRYLQEKQYETEWNRI